MRRQALFFKKITILVDNVAGKDEILYKVDVDRKFTMCSLIQL